MLYFLGLKHTWWRKSYFFSSSDSSIEKDLRLRNWKSYSKIIPKTQHKNRRLVRRSKARTTLTTKVIRGQCDCDVKKLPIFLRNHVTIPNSFLRDQLECFGYVIFTFDYVTDDSNFQPHSALQIVWYLTVVQ